MSVKFFPNNQRQIKNSIKKMVEDLCTVCYVDPSIHTTIPFCGDCLLNFTLSNLTLLQSDKIEK